MSADSTQKKTQESLSNLSYELRTRLNTIFGFLDILSTGDLGTLNPSQQDAVNRINKSSESLTESLGDILKASKESKENAVEFVKLQTTVHSHSWLIRGIFGTIVLALGWILADRSDLIKEIDARVRESISGVDAELDRHLDYHEYRSREQLKRLYDQLNERE